MTLEAGRGKRRELDEQTPLAFFADGRLITLEKDGLAYWNVGSGQRTGGLKGSYSLAGVPPYSGVACGVSGNKLSLWDVTGNRALAVFDTLPPSLTARASAPSRRMRVGR